MQKRHILLIVLFFLRVFQTQAQTENYPVSATLVFAAPFSLKVSDYFTSNTRMYLNLNLKDLTKPTLKVYLKWSLEGPGIRIATREGFIPTSFIELSKGTVSLQKGSDLSLYFQRGIFDYQGLTEDVILDGSIPEGFYTMKFQALEAGSGREVSNLAESFFFVTSPQPPIINQPFNGSTVAVTNPQNVLLQWTPRQISTLESQVVYEVTIYEVTDGDDPIVVANSGILPKFNRTVTTTSTFMGASDLPLQEGKRYAMVVTAKDLNGKMNFENGGKSEVSWFQYGKGCFAPTGLNVAETAPGKVILSWSANTTAEGYVVEYKKKTETTWIVNGSLDNSYTLNGLSPKTDYEFRVKTQCSGGKYSGYTATESVSVIGLITPTPETEVSLEDVLDPFSQTVSTKSDGKPFDPKNIDALFALLKPPACAVSGVSYVCGQTPSATPPVGIDLTTLAKGDVLGIYDYAVLVTQVSKGSSPFEGKGLVKLPFAGNIKVPVEFKGIKAKKGEDGTEGGCVWYVPSDLNEGYFQIKGSKQDAIVKEQEKLLADIYSELIDPQSFYGTFEEALTKYEAKRKAIQAIEDAGGKASKEDYQELTKYLRGIVQGGNDWKEKLLKHFGSDANKPENKAILDKLDALKAALLACEKCVADNLSTTPPKTGGGGGPMGFEDWEVNLAKCVYPDAQKEMGDIKTLVNEKRCNPYDGIIIWGNAEITKNTVIDRGSVKSKIGNAINFKDCTLLPNYCIDDKLVGYTVSLNDKDGRFNRIILQIGENQIETFKKEYNSLVGAALVYYMNGEPSDGKKKMAASIITGQWTLAWDGLIDEWKDCIKDPVCVSTIIFSTIGGALSVVKIKPAPPKIQAQINPRHILSSDNVASGITKDVTLAPREILAKDISDYNLGISKKVKNGDVLLNDRLYGIKNEGATLYPKSGGSNEFIDLNQGQIKAIQLIKKTPPDKLEQALKGAGILQKDIDFANAFIKKY